MNRSCFLREACTSTLGQLKNSILLQLPWRKELLKEISVRCWAMFRKTWAGCKYLPRMGFFSSWVKMPPPSSPQNVVYGETENKPFIQGGGRGNIICYREACNICIINTVRDGFLQRDSKPEPLYLWKVGFLSLSPLCQMLTCGPVITLNRNVVYVFWGFWWWMNSPWWLSLKWELTTVVSTSHDLNNNNKKILGLG